MFTQPGFFVPGAPLYNYHMTRLRFFSLIPFLLLPIACGDADPVVAAHSTRPQEKVRAVPCVRQGPCLNCEGTQLVRVFAYSEKLTRASGRTEIIFHERVGRPVSRCQ